MTDKNLERKLRTQLNNQIEKTNTYETYFYTQDGIVREEHLEKLGKMLEELKEKFILRGYTYEVYVDTARVDIPSHTHEILFQLEERND